MSNADAGTVVDMFKNPNYEQEEDPNEDYEDRAIEEALQKQNEEKELLELLREWKAANA